jgi:serine/threonine protein kinase
MFLFRVLQHYHRFVKSTGWFETPEDITIVMELCEHGNLETYLRSQGGKFPELLAQETTRQIFQALETMHELGFIHRDLKPEVCLTCAQESVRLSDSIFDRMFWFTKNNQSCGSKSQTLASASVCSTMKLVIAMGVQRCTWPLRCSRELLHTPARSMSGLPG